MVSFATKFADPRRVLTICRGKTFPPSPLPPWTPPDFSTPPSTNPFGDCPSFNQPFRQFLTSGAKMLPLGFCPVSSYAKTFSEIRPLGRVG